MKFTPLSDDKLNEKGDFTVLPPGQYDFEVTKAEDSQSKEGNDMIKLTLNVFDKGQKFMVWDYLTFTEKSQWKAYGFCKATGLAEKFKAGELAAFDCEGRTGELNLGIQKAKKFLDKNGNECEGEEKNTVKSYVSKDVETPVKPHEEEDTIPF